jgi:hypothetical protein
VAAGGDADGQVEAKGAAVLLPLTMAERLRHLHQLVGHALHDF